MFEIQKGVPIPPRKRKNGVDSKYPFAAMDVGDSFFVPGRKPEAFRVSAQRFRPARFRPLASVEDGITGVRVWRIK